MAAYVLTQDREILSKSNPVHLVRDSFMHAIICSTHDRAPLDSQRAVKPSALAAGVAATESCSRFAVRSGAASPRGDRCRAFDSFGPRSLGCSACRPMSLATRRLHSVKRHLYRSASGKHLLICPGGNWAENRLLKGAGSITPWYIKLWYN